MNSTINETIDALNDLTETLKDGEYGFLTAAKDVNVPELVVIFERYARQRAEFAATLQAHVAGLGAKVEKAGTVIGGLHRGRINLRAALSTNELQAVLIEAERGEDAAVVAYQKALGRDIDQATRDQLYRQLTEIEAAHDQLRHLRDDGKYRNAP
jgi:uncharacterized protein (TIGR02284 family)